LQPVDVRDTSEIDRRILTGHVTWCGASECRLSGACRKWSAHTQTRAIDPQLKSARLYRLNLKAADARPMPAYSTDRLAELKKEYEFAAKEPSNLRYGYVRAA
jgi:hypothetical protein